MAYSIIHKSGVGITIASDPHGEWATKKAALWRALYLCAIWGVSNQAVEKPDDLLKMSQKFSDNFDQLNRRYEKLTGKKVEILNPLTNRLV